MKAFVAMLLLLAATVFFLVVQSFQSRLFSTTYSPPFVLDIPAEQPPPGSGGSPRRTVPASATTSSNPGGFRGPTGQPYVIGPGSPPPGQ